MRTTTFPDDYFEAPTVAEAAEGAQKHNKIREAFEETCARITGHITGNSSSVVPVLEKEALFNLFRALLLGVEGSVTLTELSDFSCALYKVHQRYGKVEPMTPFAMGVCSAASGCHLMPLVTEEDEPERYALGRNHFWAERVRSQQVPSQIVGAEMAAEETLLVALRWLASHNPRQKTLLARFDVLLNDNKREICRVLEGDLPSDDVDERGGEKVMSFIPLGELVRSVLAPAAGIVGLELDEVKMPDMSIAVSRMGQIYGVSVKSSVADAPS